MIDDLSERRSGSRTLPSSGRRRRRTFLDCFPSSSSSGRIDWAGRLADSVVRRVDSLLEGKPAVGLGNWLVEGEPSTRVFLGLTSIHRLGTRSCWPAWGEQSSGRRASSRSSPRSVL